MKTRQFLSGLLALAATAALLWAPTARGGTRVLPFQGRLTDADGHALPDGSRVVQFKIYNAPVGGQAVWNGEVHNLTINAGLVNTLLGTKATLAGVDFNQDLYLELIVDANADGQISLSDPPLLPRQSILPAVFAWESANSRLLGGYDWTPLFGTNNPADGTFLDSKIRDAGITSAKIANAAVTRQKLDTAGAMAGQSLVFNGTDVVWSPVNAVNADNATNAANAANAGLLDGFDWASIFNNANPSSGELNVANMRSRGNLVVGGGATFNGTAQVVGNLIAPSVGINMFLNNWGLYLRAVGDFNHFLIYGNAWGNQTGFDGPILAGVGGGILGSTVNWTLRWNNSGNVTVRGTIGSGSDRNIKENFAAVDAGDILARVTSLPITRWNYKDDPTAQHIGPVSQDFRASFGLGSDDKFIATVDADGVALAAIQGLNKKLEQGDSELRALLKKQHEQIQALRAELEALKAARQ